MQSSVAVIDVYGDRDVLYLVSPLAGLEDALTEWCKLDDHMVETGDDSLWVPVVEFLRQRGFEAREIGEEIPYIKV